jgi:hypothetical protein
MTQLQSYFKPTVTTVLTPREGKRQITYGSELNMPYLDYGIYKVLPSGRSVWLENANSLEAARMRATELAQKSSSEVAVYDLRNPARAIFELKK